MWLKFMAAILNGGASDDIEKTADIFDRVLAVYKKRFG
jgi:hypothetical protein